MDMTFIGFLVRVAAPLAFDNILPFMCELCADNYVLVQGGKDTVATLGSYVRHKVINLLSSLNLK